MNSTCTSLVGFSASTASVLAEQLLPEVNQSLLMLGVEENFSLCCTRTVFSEKRSTTNKERVLLQLLIANQSAFFSRHMDIFQSTIMTLG